MPAVESAMNICWVHESDYPSQMKLGPFVWVLPTHDEAIVHVKLYWLYKGPNNVLLISYVK